MVGFPLREGCSRGAVDGCPWPLSYIPLQPSALSPPASHLPPRLGRLAPGYFHSRDPPGPPSTDAGVTPLIGSPQPWGPHQSFTVFCKHPEKPRWTRELGLVVLSPTMNYEGPMTRLLWLGGRSCPAQESFNICSGPPLPSGTRWPCPPPPPSALAWLLPCDSLGFLSPVANHSPLPGEAPWPGFETLRVPRP